METWYVLVAGLVSICHAIVSCLWLTVVLKQKSYLQRYGQSKIALIHHARKLAELHPDIRVAAVHPGRVVTGMGYSLQKESWLVRLATPLIPFISVPANVGARNCLWAATGEGVVSGKYYEPIGVPDMEQSTKDATDKNLTKRLWEWTEQENK